MMTTLRLLFPQWQGGMNPHYVFGAELLAHIVPESDQDELVRVQVPKDFTAGRQTAHGVDREEQLMAQFEDARRILQAKQPDKIITLGGDCAVSQVPFDYLHGRYDKAGIIWLDAHPDVARLEDTRHLHESVLGNLIAQGIPQFAEQVEHPFKAEHVLLAGLIEEDLRSTDKDVHRLGLSYKTPEQLRQSTGQIADWIRQHQLEQVMVHFDLDVLAPDDFRSIYPADPHSRIEDFPAAVGRLSLAEVLAIFTEINQVADLVGLTLAEHLPWDAFNLRDTLSKISIFKD